jgi:hypothetical protein
MERLIGYISSFAVIAGIGMALSQWFEWRRALVDRWSGERRGAGYV